MPDDRLRAPRQLRLIFLATMLLLSATLGWLAWRILQQDEQLAAQRVAERKETAADLAVAALDRRLAAIDQSLADLLATGAAPPAAASMPRGALWVRFDGQAVQAWPAERLTYYPQLPDSAALSDQLFRDADERAYVQRDHDGAVQALRAHAGSADPAVRAAALARIAHNHALAGRPAEALQTFEALESLDTVPVAGMPAAIAAALGRIDILERQRDPQVRTLAAALDRDLHTGRWRIAAATYRYVSQEIAPRVALDGRRESRASLAEAVEQLWDRRRHDPDVLADRASLVTSGGAVLAVTRRSGTSMAGFVADTSFIDEQWLVPAGIRAALTDRNGAVVAGQAPAADPRAAVRLASSTGLPWTVQALGSDAGDAQALGRRRTLLITGMLVLLALIVTGGWFIGHSVARELAVARLQADFVAAVSHEFRTPLTTLCQLSELLQRGRVRGDQDRQMYYELLHNESHRLRRLVEGVLNFGRLEAGRMPFELRTLDLSALVQQSATEFAQAPQAGAHRLEIHADAAATIRGDDQALRCVVWNLLENAVKYSPDGERVRITIVPDAAHVEIAVRDDGIGIPRREQQRIFEKFVRGAAARDRNIGGTGLGLAMARQIIRAHGGDIVVESDPDRGSTFRVRLPRAVSA